MFEKHFSRKESEQSDFLYFHFYFNRILALVRQNYN